MPASSSADVQINVVSLTTTGGLGLQRTTFAPGEQIQYQATINVLQASSGPFKLLLRVAGDGWYETHEEEITGLGLRTISWGGLSDPLYTSTAVCEGKVSLYLSVLAGEGESVVVQGRRHGYLTIQCPSGRPAGMVTASLEVGELPFDMALTRDGRFLYVTSRESRNISIIDTDLAEVVTVIPPDWDEILEKVEACQAQCAVGDVACRSACREQIEPLGEPSGLALSPDGTQMLVADYRRPVIHLVDTRARELQGEISLDAFKPMKLTDVVVDPSPQANELFVADFSAERVFRVGLTPPHETVALPTNYISGTGFFSTKLVFDPIDLNELYVLNLYLIKLNRFGTPLDLFRLNDPAPPWTMVFNPRRELRELYVVLSPSPLPLIYPFEPRSYLYRWKFAEDPVEGRGFRIGSNIGDLVVREDGRYAYTVDSYRSEILLVDLERMAELRGCAIPLEGGTGGRNMLADPNGNRLYVGAWSPGSVLFVE